jgi:hypothetical protein
MKNLTKESMRSTISTYSKNLRKRKSEGREKSN